MNEIFSYLSDHATIIIQAVVFLCVNLVFHHVKKTSDDIRGLQADIRQQNEKFKDYITNEKCEYHRKLIDAHMARTDAKLAEFAKQCKKKCNNTCKNKTENT